MIGLVSGVDSVDEMPERFAAADPEERRTMPVLETADSPLERTRI